MLNKFLKFIILFIFPISLFAQYPDSGNKLRLGFQTTADGLIWRDSSNTARYPTPTSNKNTYVVLDTLTNKIYHYKNSTWTLVGGDTTSLSNRIDALGEYVDSIAVNFQDSIDAIQNGYFKQEFPTVTSDTLLWTKNVQLPLYSDDLLVFRNGQFLNNTQYTRIDTNKIKIAATSYKIGNNYTIVYLRGGGAGDGNQFDSTILNLQPRLDLKLNISDTASMLTNYYRSGRALGTPSSGVLTFAMGLPISTGLTGLGAANRIPYAASTTALTTSSALTFDATLGRLVVNGISAVSGGQSFIVNNSTPLALFTIANTGSITARGTGNIVFNSFSSGQNRYQLYSDGNTNNPLIFYINGGAKGSAYGEFVMNADFDANAYIGGGFYFDTRDNVAAPVSIVVKDNNANPVRSASFMEDGEVFIGYQYGDDKGNYRLQVKDSVYVGGNVSAAAYTTRSDYNLKDDIFDLKYGLNDILQLQPVEYTYKSNGSKQLGFIAQDIGTILPEVVSFEESMSVNYQAIIPILTKAIQEQNALIKALEQRIINLENK